MDDRADEIRSTRAPKLREDQIEVLSRYGQTRKTKVGEVLFRAGDISNDFIVVLEGEVEVIDDFAGEARTMGVMRAGRFVGDLNMLTGQAIYLSAVVREGGEVLMIPRERLKEVVTEEPNLSDIILKAFLARRSWGMRTGGDTWPSPSYGRSTLGHPPSSGAPTKSTSPARKHRKVALDKKGLLMEVREVRMQGIG
jgi:hypothetical protein